MELRVGCTGWGYEKWVGSFYPKNLSASGFLKFYSSIFDITEVNSTYYRIPNRFVTKKWFDDTPNNFKLTAKFPKKITHELKLQDVKKDTMEFLGSLQPLKGKIFGLVLQLPPSLSFEEAKPRLDELFSYLPKDFRYPIEGRDESWFSKEALQYLEEKEICLVWSEIAGLDNPAPITSDYIYLRLIGDRQIQEEEFGKIVRDKKAVIKKWAQKLKGAENKVSLAIAMANNHLEGFAPQTANTLRMEMGLEELLWHDKNQKTLADF